MFFKDKVKKIIIIKHVRPSHDQLCTSLWVAFGLHDSITGPFDTNKNSLQYHFRPEEEDVVALFETALSYTWVQQRCCLPPLLLRFLHGSLTTNIAAVSPKPSRQSHV